MMGNLYEMVIEEVLKEKKLEDIVFKGLPKKTNQKKEVYKIFGKNYENKGEYQDAFVSYFIGEEYKKAIHILKENKIKNKSNILKKHKKIFSKYPLRYKSGLVCKICKKPLFNEKKCVDCNSSLEIYVPIENVFLEFLIFNDKEDNNNLKKILEEKEEIIKEKTSEVYDSGLNFRIAAHEDIIPNYLYLIKKCEDGLNRKIKKEIKKEFKNGYINKKDITDFSKRMFLFEEKGEIEKSLKFLNYLIENYDKYIGDYSENYIHLDLTQIENPPENFLSGLKRGYVTIEGKLGKNAYNKINFNSFGKKVFIVSKKEDLTNISKNIKNFRISENLKLKKKEQNRKFYNKKLIGVLPHKNKFKKISSAAYSFSSLSASYLIAKEFAEFSDYFTSIPIEYDMSINPILIGACAAFATGITMSYLKNYFNKKEIGKINEKIRKYNLPLY